MPALYAKNWSLIAVERAMRIILSILFGLLVAACSREVPIRGEMIFTDGTIYTGVTEGETVEAVAVGEGLIVYAGSMENAIKVSKSGARIIQLNGATMFPGFTDAHAHLLGIGQREMTLNLDAVKSVTELQDALTAYLEVNPDAQTILGRGWIETHWPEGRFPNASDLDAIVPDRPVILIRADGHASVVNSAAMTEAGITGDTVAPDGGAILLGDDGQPTGMLIDKAMSLVGALITEPSDTQIEQALTKGYDVYASRGWTGLHNMSVGPKELAALGRMARRNEIVLRTYNAVTPDQIATAVNRAPNSDRMQTRAVKIYMDGALGSRGALLSAPYEDAPETRGLALREKDETIALFKQALDGDVQMAVHAIGDLGNTRALDWMEEVFALLPEPIENDEGEIIDFNPRWRIEHAQVVQSKDQARFSELGVIASMQPSHAIGDLHFAPARLGYARLDGAYAWSDLIEKGTVIAGGSDAPVEVGSPIIEFYAATVRRDLSGFAGEGWNIDQRLSRYDALKLFTQNSAFTSFQEETLGTIESGKLADLTVFNQDLMTIEDNKILDTKAVMTVVQGEIVFDAR